MAEFVPVALLSEGLVEVAPPAVDGVVCARAGVASSNRVAAKVKDCFMVRSDTIPPLVQRSMD